MLARKTLALTAAIGAAAILATAAVGGSTPAIHKHPGAPHYLFAPDGTNKLQYIRYLEGEDIIAGCLLVVVNANGSSITRKAAGAVRCMRHYHVLAQFRQHFQLTPAPGL